LSLLPAFVSLFRQQMIKYTKPFLDNLERIVAETDYVLRYEKGSFKSGYCILKDSKVIVVNRYFTLEGRINSLVDIIRSLGIDLAMLSEKSKKHLLELQAT
jgi:hypothetical protein